MDNASVVAGNATTGLKHFIIGKLWAKSRNGQNPGVLRINRNLPANITLTPGTTLFLTRNNKREGKIDADYSVTVLLDEKVANDLITKERQATSERNSGGL